MFKVLIKRTVPAGKEKALLELVTQLRIGASGQLGYISGETLRNTAKPNEYIVISVWDCEKSWEDWLATDERIALQSRIDALIGSPTVCEMYEYPNVRSSV